jgi:hypothetical protein
MVKALFIFTSLRGCGCLKSRFPIVREKRSIPNNRKWLGIGSWDSVKPLKRVIGSKAIKLPFLVFLDRYMTDIVAHTRRPKTIESYESLIRLNVKPELGNVKLTALRPDHLQNLYSPKLNQGLVFVTSHGTPISPRNLIRHFKQALKEAGLPEIRFHDLRRTHASLLLAAGVHPKLVQERLGRSQINLKLDTYSHVIPSLQKEAAEKMKELFK